MTIELRAAYEQMDDVWKCLPDEFRFDEDGRWWAKEAGDGLAAYGHPTMTGLGLPLAEGGFADAEAPASYLRLAVWLGRLGCGYGLALGYLVSRLINAFTENPGCVTLFWREGAMGRPISVLEVTAEEKREVERRVGATTTPTRDCLRAHIVLLRSEGVGQLEVASRLGVSAPSVSKWSQSTSTTSAASASSTGSGRPGTAGTTATKRGRSLWRF